MLFVVDDEELDQLPEWKRRLFWDFYNACFAGKTPDGLVVTFKSLSIKDIFNVIKNFKGGPENGE